jgi:hypothetical protein
MPTPRGKEGDRFESIEVKRLDAVQLLDELEHQRLRTQLMRGATTTRTLIASGAAQTTPRWRRALSSLAKSEATNSAQSRNDKSMELETCAVFTRSIELKGVDALANDDSEARAQDVA